MGAENSKLRASSLRILRTLSGGRFRGNSSKYNSTTTSLENLNGPRGSKNSLSSSGIVGGKPKSESVRFKTKWPYPHVEKDFLPVYNMKSENQKDFTISHVIASGAYGSVLLGKENKNQREVAIKVIDKARVLSEGQGAIQQCKDEVLIQSDLPKSQYVVELVAFWQTRNRLYLVLEYIPNGELFDLWKTVRIFSESLARFYLTQITLALDFLHRNNVVYRDLKMENILLDAEAGIKLIDFGLSKQLREGERTTTTCGTLQYTAPEVLRGDPYGLEVDWWSMGVLGYALLAGKFPVFGARDHVEMRQMVAQHQYRMPIHLSNEASDLLTLLLQKNCAHRVHSLEDLIRIRYYRTLLNMAQPNKLHLRDFVTKADLEKIPEVYALRSLFNRAFLDSIAVGMTQIVPSVVAAVSSDMAVAVEALGRSSVSPEEQYSSPNDSCSVATSATVPGDNSSGDYAEPIWTMTSGKTDQVIQSNTRLPSNKRTEPAPAEHSDSRRSRHHENGSGSTSLRPMPIFRGPVKTVVTPSAAQGRPLSVDVRYAAPTFLPGAARDNPINKKGRISGSYNTPTSLRPLPSENGSKRQQQPKFYQSPTDNYAMVTAPRYGPSVALNSVTAINGQAAYYPRASNI